MYATGGTQSPLRFLVFLHLVAVSLLASYRTGLKVALWHSLLLFVVLYAQAAQLVPPVDVLPGRGIDFSKRHGLKLNVTSFWAWIETMPWIFENWFAGDRSAADAKLASADR